MATLEQQRQAIGAAMTASRTGGSTTQEQRRQSIGARMTADRTGASMVEDINRLAAPSQQRDPLPIIEPVGALPAARGRGVYVPPETTGGGIASPLTEPDYSAREWWPDGMPSSDGLFILPALKKVVLQDANALEVIIEYAEPV